MSTQGYKGQADKNALDRGLQAFAQTKFGGVLFVTLFPAIDRKLMPLTRGRVGMSGTFPALVLHCRGAKTGEAREVPLLYTPRGGEMILIASKAGSLSNPAWYYNLKAHPDVEVEVGKRRMKVTAREVFEAEREACWKLATDNYNGYDTYQGRAGERVIPVFVLQPLGG